MPVSAVFFDLDGTLVDSNEQHVLAWDEAFREVGSNFSREVIHDQIGKGADMLVPALLPDLEEDKQLALARRVGEIFKGKYLAGIRPFPGARELLARVHRAGQKVVFATSASGEERDHYVELLEAEEIVYASTSADDVQHTKPAPDVFAAALKKVAPLEASQVIVVGDTPYDVVAATRCGIATIAVCSGKFRASCLKDAGAARIYNDVAELLANYEHSPLNG